MKKVNMQNDAQLIVSYLTRFEPVFIPCAVNITLNTEAQTYGYLLEWNGNHNGHNVDTITLRMVAKNFRHNVIIGSYVWYKDVHTYTLCLKSITNRYPVLNDIDGYLPPLNTIMRGDVFYEYLQFVNFDGLPTFNEDKKSC